MRAEKKIYVFEFVGNDTENNTLGSKTYWRDDVRILNTSEVKSAEFRFMAIFQLVFNHSASAKKGRLLIKKPSFLSTFLLHRNRRMPQFEAHFLANYFARN